MKRSAPDAAGAAEASAPRGDGRRTGTKMDYFFPLVPFEQRAQLRADEVALFSISDQRSADSMTDLLLCLIPASSRVTDATACVGGNTFSFARRFSHVNAVEFDAGRFDMLRHNARVLGLANLSFVQGDYVSQMAELQQDAVFIDPPWGGPDYKLKERVALFLGETPLANVCAKLRSSGKTALIMAKGPLNWDYDDLLGALFADCAASGLALPFVARFEYRKMAVLVVDYRGARSNLLETLRNHLPPSIHSLCTSVSWYDSEARRWVPAAELERERPPASKRQRVAAAASVDAAAPPPAPASAPGPAAPGSPVAAAQAPRRAHAVRPSLATFANKGAAQVEVAEAARVIEEQRRLCAGLHVAQVFAGLAPLDAEALASLLEEPGTFRATWNTWGAEAVLLVSDRGYDVIGSSGGDVLHLLSMGQPPNEFVGTCVAGVVCDERQEDGSTKTIFFALDVVAVPSLSTSSSPSLSQQQQQLLQLSASLAERAQLLNILLSKSAFARREAPWRLRARDWFEAKAVSKLVQKASSLPHPTDGVVLARERSAGQQPPLLQGFVCPRGATLDALARKMGT